MKRMPGKIQRMVMVLGVAFLTAATGFAQGSAQQTPMKGAVLKGKAPVSKEILRVSLPKAHESNLPNGLRVLVLENHKLPTFAMQMVILSGGLTDPPDLHGLAQFTSLLLREGTSTRSSRQIAEQVDSLGASLSAGTGMSSISTEISSSGLTDSLDQVMGLFADVILNPTFPPEELAKLKTRTLAQLRMQRSRPAFLATEMFNKVMYGNHPASRIVPTEAEIQRLTPELLSRFHSTYYRPNNAIFAIVGDVKPAEITNLMGKWFGAWHSGDVPPTQIPKVKDTGASRIYVIDRPGSVQTNFLLGTLAIERTDPDYATLTVANRIIGGGPSARLFMNLREDKGYTYGAYSSFSAYKYRGVFQANTEVRTSVTDGAMKELTTEIRRLSEEKVPQEEFDNAKRALIGNFALQLESPQTLLANIITQKIYGLPSDYWDTYPRQISSVTPEDVQRVAGKYIDLKHLEVVAVGDAKQIAAPLRRYGPVEIYDTEGRPAGTPVSEEKGADARN